jgi:hypothetical protein
MNTVQTPTNVGRVFRTYTSDSIVVNSSIPYFSVAYLVVRWTWVHTTRLLNLMPITSSSLSAMHQHCSQEAFNLRARDLLLVKNMMVNFVMTSRNEFLPFECALPDTCTNRDICPFVNKRTCITQH